MTWKEDIAAENVLLRDRVAELEADNECLLNGRAGQEDYLRQSEAEVGALREERETLLTRITELEAAIADALEQLRVLRQEIT